MRIINHKQPRQAPADYQRKTRRTLIIGVILVVLVVVGVVLFVTQKSSAPPVTTVQKAINQSLPETTKKGTLKTFTGDQFKDLYNSFTYPNTQRINESTPITGNDAADTKIRQIAEARGYKLRSAPVANAFETVAPGFELQQRAAQPWRDLMAAAQKDNVRLGLTAAYRSAEDQKQIFLQRLAQQNIPVEGIASGTYDGQISQVLRTTAVPGYSRHHTGYTIDISCEDMPNSSFMYTNCFKWLEANNYEHAKNAGWIPSYPEGTSNQGPDPESWEYVWVGKDAVTE